MLKSLVYLLLEQATGVLLPGLLDGLFQHGGGGVCGAAAVLGFHRDLADGLGKRL
ncbi:hypothetical protein ABZ904_36525 [Streptomyces sp. NPDC046900]|uniref:hypothetical protein n=1 Tax=Streptomyces sp. NPDC046900 TaxID=3155473 RepID=UPI0033F568EE